MLEYCTTTTPLGDVMLVGSSSLVRLAFEDEGFEAVLEGVRARLGPVRPGDLLQARTQLGEYFTGQRRGFDLELDLSLTTPWRASVVRVLAAVPHGTRVTYSQLAASTGQASSVRACATACATNPLPIVLPCHRVVPASGGVGQYLGGPARKSWLLDFETRARSAAYFPDSNWTKPG